MTKDNNPWTGLSSNEDFYDNNPWPGLSSYEDPTKSDRKLKFCGRDNDIFDVTRLIDDNLLLVLYGKSGIGKTSLLKAGVFPKLRLEQYLPVSMRLGTLGSNASYQEAIISAVKNAVEEVNGNMSTCPVVEEQTDNQQPNRLWNYFARHRFVDAKQQPLFPVIVLDQFEEVLRSTSPEHLSKAQTLLNQIQYLIDESHALGNSVVEGKEYFYDFNFRFVISIREDELYLLEDNIDDLSLSMFRNCRYRLRSLSIQGATEAIIVPGKDCIAKEEQQVVVDRIIELSKRPQSNDIDTLLLSLVCTGTYGKKAGKKITLSDLAIWKSNPMEVYYQDAINDLTANQVRYIQRYFIREDGSRKRVDAKEVKTALGGNTYYSMILGENRMLVLAENNQVELLHDQLALAVYEERKAFEERERKKKLRRRTIFIGFFVLTIAGVFMFQNYRLKQQGWKMMENRARFLAEKAHTLLDEGDSYSARRLLLEINPKSTKQKDRPYTSEEEYALREACAHNNAILRGHNCAVSYAEFSPNGKLIVSSSSDETVRIWDAETGRQVHILNGHSWDVESAVFSPDGKKIVSASRDKTVRIWDVESGQQIHKLEGHTHDVKYATFSPDGKYVVSISFDNIVRIWDVESGQQTHVLYGDDRDYGKYVTYTPDGKCVAVASNSEIAIWDVESETQINSIPYRVNTIDYSPDGKSLVTASSDSTMIIWDVKSGMRIRSFEGHTAFVNSAYYSYDGNYIVSTSRNIIRVWDIESGQVVRTIEGPAAGFHSSLFSSDGKRLVSASYDHTIRILDVDIKQELFTFEKWATGNYGEGIGEYYVDFSMDGKYILSLASKAYISDEEIIIKVWDFESKREVSLLEKDTSFVLPALRSALCYSYNDEIYVTACFDQNHKCIIEVRDAKTHQTLNELEGRFKSVNTMAFSPNGEQIVAAFPDNNVRIWNVKTGKLVHVLEGHTNEVESALFSPDGRHVVSSSWDHTVKIWDVETESVIHTLTGHNDWVTCSSYSPDGRYIVSASFDNTVKIWNAETGKEVRTFKGHNGAVRCAHFSPDGKHIISASDDRTIRIWEFPALQDLIDETHERFKDNPLTAEERRMYYLE